MLNTQEAWDKAKDYLQDKLGKAVFETWILPLRSKQENEDNLILEAPDNFFRDWVDKHYRQAIQEAINWSAKQEVRVNLETASQAKAGYTAPGAQQLPAKPKESKDTSGLNSRYTFENFVVGPSNRHAHAYSLAVAESPAKAYNPLFIYGGVGLGKTHLMQAICHHAKNKLGGDLKICYMTSERFTNELIDAIQHHSTPAFRQKYRNNVGVLVIDDIHFIAGKESTQEEFFHTFNTLYDAHKQIIISSDRPPKEIANLQDRLVSRFGWGLTIDIQPPDFETRVAILKKKIEREPVLIPDDVIFFIAQLIKTNVRELEGALIRTIAYSLLEEKPITLELTKGVLKDLLREPRKLITVDFIQRCVVEEFGVSLQEIKMKRRNKNIVYPRQIAMYLSRELTDLSLPEIGTCFGGKDHTTVLHSYKKIKEDLKKDETLKERVERIIQVIQQ
ncbi:MAG: chromosomal replication initiator protein DnaA [Candidatus Omnitrophica bacterium CG23_combo_of_CG06-09_8_20_14_all_40_11]|nr:MAG: chromosomal replication initiator protein DnaA [Candidatus Omnitrophica bacterium CG23_combo_of_CG06-09_8_20_14_all_40_11]